MVVLYLEQCFNLQIYYMYFKIRAKMVQNTNGSIVVAAKNPPTSMVHPHPPKPQGYIV